MKTIERSITVNVPLNRAYNQWTQFEQFPVFMAGIKEVKQLDDKRLRWKADIGGRTKEWDAEIVEQVPDQRITWRSTSGAPNSGTIQFSLLTNNKTQVKLHLQYEPRGLAENVGDLFGMMSSRISEDLKRYKDFIEKRPVDAHGWRGEIHGMEVKQGK